MLKEFNTIDSKGCQFKVYANYYTKKTINDIGSEFKIEKVSEYSAFDFNTTSLSELKKLVGNM